MAVTSIEDLFVNELRDIYSAEKQLTRALPRMAKAAKHPDLREAFESHLEETRGQIERLDQVFEQLDVPKRAKKCEAMEGLIEEAREHMEELDDKALLDVGMIISAQKVEHYEIAGYGSLVALAKQLGHAEAAGLLAETLDEEKAADLKLNKIAASVNAEAAQSLKEGPQSPVTVPPPLSLGADRASGCRPCPARGRSGWRRRSPTGSASSCWSNPNIARSRASPRSAPAPDPPGRRETRRSRLGTRGRACAHGRG